MSNKTLKEHIDESVNVVSRVEQWKVHSIDAQFLHAIMGIVDESGELMKICKDRMFYDKGITLVEMMEEFGDLWYYFTLAMSSISRLYNISVVEAFEMVLRVNKTKLQTRYPVGYSYTDAIYRDRAKEHEAMVKACQHEEADTPLPLHDIDIIGKDHSSLTVQS